MKKTVSAGLGGRNFIFDVDAYERLDAYLKAYSDTLTDSRREVMEEVEMRVAELLREKLAGREVVSVPAVDEVARQMGLPDPGTATDGAQADRTDPCGEKTARVHKFYRDVDERKVGGVCSGIAAYCDIDPVVVRIVTVILAFFGTAGFWIYLVVCLVAPSAYTAAQKCELHGLPCTAENLRKFTDTVR